MTQPLAGLPNLFHYATSELSQDATLAYLLSWAKPKYQTSHPQLNRIGETLLRELIQSAAAGTAGKEANLLPQEQTITSLKVGTQRNNIDVWAEVNDEIFLILEDKTTTTQHSDQIARYIKTAQSFTNGDEKSWPHILAVYVKTGNESKKSHPKSGSYGVFLREDILRATSTIPGCGNNIAEEFYHHLSAWESDTTSYQTVPVEETWSPRARQGYYLDLENRLCKLHDEQGKDCDAGWGYVPNPSGGFWGFWWHRRSLASESCRLYLQIEDGKRLQVRVSDAIDSDGKPKRADAKLLHRLRGRLEDRAQQFSDMNIRKAGTYRGGRYAGIVDISFGNCDTYLASDETGLVDLDRTMCHLKMAMELVDAACKQLCL